MRVKKLALALSSVGLLGCFSSETQEKPNDRVILHDVVAFLSSDGRRYSVNATDIPQSAIDYLGRRYQDTFVIGDSSHYWETTYSDVHISESGEKVYQYQRMLHFVLLSDTACLIAYTQGGVGAHSVVDYLAHEDLSTHTRYTTLENIDDTMKLRRYLESGPNPVK